MATIYISLGSNIDREANLRAAVAALRAQFGAVRLSPVYETEAVGFAGEPFFNLVAEAQTNLPPHAVVASLRAIEDAQRRDRSQPKFSPRTLDLDLLLYDERITRDADYHLPRDEIDRYAFVLAPLADLAPERLHPVRRQTYRALWQQMATNHASLKRVAITL